MMEVRAKGTLTFGDEPRALESLGALHRDLAWMETQELVKLEGAQLTVDLDRELTQDEFIDFHEWVTSAPGDAWKGFIDLKDDGMDEDTYERHHVGGRIEKRSGSIDP